MAEHSEISEEDTADSMEYTSPSRVKVLTLGSRKGAKKDVQVDSLLDVSKRKAVKQKPAFKEWIKKSLQKVGGVLRTPGQTF